MNVFTFSVAVYDDANTDAGIGFNISGFGGSMYSITDRFGVVLELGMIFNQVYGETGYRITEGGEVRTGRVDFVMDGFQFHVNFGVFLSF